MREPSALPQQRVVDLSTDTRSHMNTCDHSDNPAIAGAQLHAVGSIADISANWSAKVVVASHEQVQKHHHLHNAPLLLDVGVMGNLPIAGRQVQDGRSI